MNALVLAARIAILIAVLVQLGSAVDSPEVNKTCLACPLVNHPLECRTFVEVLPNERCFTEVLLLTNASTAFKFGSETATECANSSSMASPHADQRRMANNNISLCHECCTESLCNRKLCGIPESNNTNLACLTGQSSRGIPLPVERSITYCNEGEQCYAGITRYAVPNYVFYGCATQDICDQLSGVLNEDEPSIYWQKCCSLDGCNAHSRRTTASPMRFTDCWDLRNRGNYTEDGEYDIYPAPGHSHVRVRCDMTTDGGGWVILQRRYDGSVNFTRTFQEYKEGFGEVNGEYWLGLDWMHTLTSRGEVRLRVDLCTFAGQAGYAEYDRFAVTGQGDRYPNDGYRIMTGVYSGGTAEDKLVTHHGFRFQADGSCADRYRGGWWYNSLHICFYGTNLNGGRYNGGIRQGIVWRFFGRVGRVYYPSLRSSEMKIRPVHVTGDPSRAYTCPT